MCFLSFIIADNTIAVLVTLCSCYFVSFYMYYITLNVIYLTLLYKVTFITFEPGLKPTTLRFLLHRCATTTHNSCSHQLCVECLCVEYNLELCTKETW